MTQPKARPPFFVLFGNSVEAIPESYKRYLVNGLRETFASSAFRSAFRCARAATIRTRRRSGGGRAGAARSTTPPCPRGRAGFWADGRIDGLPKTAGSAPIACVSSNGRRPNSAIKSPRGSANSADLSGALAPRREPPDVRPHALPRTSHPTGSGYASGASTIPISAGSGRPASSTAPSFNISAAPRRGFPRNR